MAEVVRYVGTLWGMFEIHKFFRGIVYFLQINILNRCSAVVFITYHLMRPVNKSFYKKIQLLL